MRKIIFSAAVLLLGSWATAENLQFVTTLSSPLGTFAQLETANPLVVAKSPIVNFCNMRVSAGTISVKGANSYLQRLNLKANTTLGGTIGEYRIGTTFNVGSGGHVIAGRLMGNTVSFDGANDAKSEVTGTMYLSNASTVQGAKTTTLTIPGQVEVTTAGGGDSLEWSNAYNCDYKETASEPGSSGNETYLRYNSTKGRFESTTQTDLYDSCDNNPLVRYTGTPSSKCFDIWLNGDKSHMLNHDLGTVFITESGNGCATSTPCSSFWKVVPVCNGSLPSGTILADGKDISFALSSSNVWISEGERWKHYVPTRSSSQQFFGDLKSRYDSFGDVTSTFNACIKDIRATSQGKRYEISLGSTQFLGKEISPGSEGGAGCEGDKTYSSFLLKSK